MPEPQAATTPFPWPEGKRCAVSLTFDDARLTQADRGLPILDAQGVAGSFYVSFGNLERRPERWKQAVEDGHEIGNHSLNHPCTANFWFIEPERALEGYTLEKMEAELLEANARIEQLLGVTPQTFAYPCGMTFVGRGEQQRSYVPVVAKHFLVGRRGFDETPNDPAVCDLAMATGMMMDEVSWEQVEPLLDQTMTQRRWLILAGHEIHESHRQSVRPDVLEQLCRFCTDPANAVWIDTVQNIGRYVRDHQTL